MEASAQVRFIQNGGREFLTDEPIQQFPAQKQYFDFPSTPIRRRPPQSGLAEACKLLIKNCIICWNYLYLSRKLEEIKDTASRVRKTKFDLLKPDE